MGGGLQKVNGKCPEKMLFDRWSRLSSEGKVFLDALASLGFMLETN